MNFAPRMHPDDLRAIMAASIASDPLLGERKDWADFAIECATGMIKKLGKVKSLAPEPPASDADPAPVSTAFVRQEAAREERERIINLLASPWRPVRVVIQDSANDSHDRALSGNDLRILLEPES